MSAMGKRLRTLRELKGMTQIELAKELSVSNTTVSQWETSRRNPDSDMLTRIADQFQVSVDFLLGRTDYLGFAQPLPLDLQKFIEEESTHDYPYLRLAKGLKSKDLSPVDLEVIVEIWMYAKARRK
jgi:transcriptional regulator with XRE-family HTH domain